MPVILAPFVIMGLFAKIVNMNIVKKLNSGSVHSNHNTELDKFVSLICNDINSMNEWNFYSHDKKNYSETTTSGIN